MATTPRGSGPDRECLQTGVRGLGVSGCVEIESYLASGAPSLPVSGTTSRVPDGASCAARSVGGHGTRTQRRDESAGAR